ncbi:MAG TPA: twin-arginine translocase TatA/TatE family subunit [Thermoanaerobaculia bacterium]|jgi:TatA/E family protein of Tat protein translocase
MGSLGFTEIAFIFVLALLIFGPKKLPEIGRTLGRGVAEFRKATNELKRSINTELALDEIPTPAKLRALAFDDEEPPPPLTAAPPSGEPPALTEARSAEASPAEPAEPS